MPTAAPKPCKDCGVLVYDGSQRCALHKAKAGSFADKRRGTRQERGYGAQWDRARAETLAEQGGICQPHLRRGFVVPGCRIVDHIVPKAQGGNDDKANRQAICSECHGIKSSVEALLARGLVPSGIDDEVLASMTPAAWAARASARPAAGPARPSAVHPGGGEIFGLSSVRTEPQGKFLRAGMEEGGVPLAALAGVAR